MLSCHSDFPCESSARRNGVPTPQRARRAPFPASGLSREVAHSPLQVRSQAWLHSFPDPSPGQESTDTHATSDRKREHPEAECCYQCLMKQPPALPYP